MTEIAPAAPQTRRLAVLDGWRGISILLVLATHMLPLGPPSWRLANATGNIVNLSAGNLGMSLFFILSGFLITTNLLQHGNILEFGLRRVFRILPLALLFMLLVLPFLDMSHDGWLAHLSFSVNYFSQFFAKETLHLWSLCIELHFYLFIGILFALFGKKGLYALPFILLLVSMNNFMVIDGDNSGMQSHIRVDEILAGCVLALIHYDNRAKRLRYWLGRLPFALLLAILVGSCISCSFTPYWLRSYAAMAVIGHTLYRNPSPVFHFLESRFLYRVAEISYALYVIHPITIAGWLGQGSLIVKYAKRPISIAMSFGLAYISTNYYEKFFIEGGKRLSRFFQERSLR